MKITEADLTKFSEILYNTFPKQCAHEEDDYETNG
jgi:hypothetical protein